MCVCVCEDPLRWISNSKLSHTAFTNARIIGEQLSNSSRSDLDDDERGPGVLDAKIAVALRL